MKIEKNIKKPKKTLLRETLSNMEVGDSVLVCSDKQYNSIWVWFNRRGMKCERAKEESGKIRIWRTK